MTDTRTEVYVEPVVSRGGGLGTGLVRALAVLFVLMGLVLLGGGLYLISLGGSWYYALAGIGLLLTGWRLWQLRPDAALIYALVWVLTVIWSFWEVGTNWWAHVPRVVAPTVLLVAVLLALPALRRWTGTVRTIRR